jgi:hypothetical protein
MLAISSQLPGFDELAALIHCHAPDGPHDARAAT